LEGVKYDVNWSKFKRGSSIFLPCLDRVKARQEVREFMQAHRFKVLIKLAVMDGISGLKIWRV
tara:strand:+ start:402 stop:590 length:189 start_codon:yes stop_codon:yes gene_type:complete